MNTHNVATTVYEFRWQVAHEHNWEYWITPIDDVHSIDAPHVRRTSVDFRWTIQMPHIFIIAHSQLARARKEIVSHLSLVEAVVCLVSRKCACVQLNSDEHRCSLLTFFSGVFGFINSFFLSTATFSKYKLNDCHRCWLWMIRLTNCNVLLWLRLMLVQLNVLDYFTTRDSNRCQQMAHCSTRSPDAVNDDECW